MKQNFQKTLIASSIVAASAEFAAPSYAQQNNDSLMLEEIVVTARRRDENLQDVPLTVNAVSSKRLDELNIRNFEDVQVAVAGINLKEDNINPQITMRGVTHDNFTGASAAVAYYVNDAPVSNLTVFQAMFDIGQLEILRGPQGTLRGFSTPSGSITLTTQRPEFNELGGYVDATATSLDSQNVRAAINLPIIDDVLAARLAVFREESEAQRVESLANGDTSEYSGEGYRFSVSYQPTDDLAIDLMYQRIKSDRSTYFWIESDNTAEQNIAAEDRLAFQTVPETAAIDNEVTRLNISYDFNDHSVKYTGVYTDEHLESSSPIDTTGALPDSFPSEFSQAAQVLDSQGDSYAHELRFQSIAPMWDKFGYVAGIMHYVNASGGTNASPSLNEIVDLADPNAPPIYTVGATNVLFGKSGSPSKETSVYANLTYYVGEDTELSAGVRHIDYKKVNYLVLTNFGITLQDDELNEESDIFILSAKHNFNDDIMAYASFGTAWRIGGDRSLESDLANATPFQAQYIITEPEESESLEVGLKTTTLNGKLRFNITAYHQEFDNYPLAVEDIYSLGVDQVFGGNIVNQSGYVAAVPAEVNGLELEAYYQATESLFINAMLNYAKGEVDNSDVPCNDYYDTEGNIGGDGQPDASGLVPTVDDIIATGENITVCSSSQRIGTAPLWSANISTQYSFKIGELDSYIRGLVNWYGDSQNQPTNTIDDVDAYSTLNMYAGVSDPNGKWSAMLFVKNLTDEQQVISRNANTGTVNVGTAANFGGFIVPLSTSTYSSDYREVSVTPEREIGINLKYNF